MSLNFIHFNSLVGTIELSEESGFLTSLRIIDSEIAVPKTDSTVLNDAKKQLEEYFAGERKDFNIPIKQDGTDFQQKVWKSLTTIPYGKTISYKELAQSVGNEKASRAVGSANGYNHIAIIVPCHRVINSNGDLGGYAYGAEIKRTLLNIEEKYK